MLAYILAQTTSLKLDLGDLAVVAGTVATMMGIFQAIVKFGDRLWGQRKKNESEQQAAAEAEDRREFPGMPTSLAAKQSIGCHMQHTELKSFVSSMSTDTQNAIRDMAHNIDKFREVVQESHTAAEVRHATIIAKLENIGANQHHRRD